MAETGDQLYFASLSARTLIYKGMLTTAQLATFYPDLHDERFASAIALVHSRFSTNTFPSWPLAQPFRLIAHNGEINTVGGNRNWMQARQALLASDLLAGPDDDLARLFPICTPDGSDSASFDEVLELLHLGGRSLPHAVLMMIPEAWENAGRGSLRPGSDPAMESALRDFYAFHSTLMEPWDGPACVSFTDGTVIGAVLDRNGLRPGRWWRTSDDLVILASEAGVIELDPATVVGKGRLQPGRMFLVDTAAGEIRDDAEIKAALAAEHPYGDWLHTGLLHLDALPDREHVVHTHESVTRRQQLFGYTEEELRVVLKPMAETGVEPLGSMGTDTPPAVLSQRPRLLFDYFAELFAQVTNPPLDAIREEMVTSLAATIGPEQNLLDPSPASCRQIVLPRPVIDNDDLAKIWHVNADGDLPGFRCALIDGRYRVHGGGPALAAALRRVRDECSAAAMDPARRDFYAFHSTLMEPWDGPACISFTDGTVIGAVLDRNGLRPGRWWRTSDDLVILASEAGVIELDPATVIAKGRLQPGRMFLVDTAAGEIRDDAEIKAALAAEHPYGDWLHAGLLHLDTLPAREHVVHTHESVTRRQQLFGYTEEELRVLLKPMAETGAEPLGSMGTDTPPAVLSKRPRLLFDYFAELFAQVTNPPLDAIREELVTSLAATIGPEQNLLDPTPASCRQIVLPRPVIDNDDLAKIWHVNADGDLPGFQCALIDGRYRVHGGGPALAAALQRVQRRVQRRGRRPAPGS